MVKQEIKNVDSDPQSISKAARDDITPPKAFQIKPEPAVSGFTASTGVSKRLGNSLRDPAVPDMSSDEEEDPSNLQDEDMLTPYGSGHPFTNIHAASSGSDIKPFRNVIKRYWTEDEVSEIMSLFRYQSLCLRTRTCGCSLINTG